MNHEPVQDIPADFDAGDNERLAQKLREAREYLGLSQEFVAEQLGVARAAVSAIETAKRKVSGLELKQLARLYRRTYEYFLGDNEANDQDDATVAALYRTSKKLSDKDKEQVLMFARFLQQAGSGPRSPRENPEESDR